MFFATVYAFWLKLDDIALYLSFASTMAWFTKAPRTEVDPVPVEPVRLRVTV